MKYKGPLGRPRVTGVGPFAQQSDNFQYAVSDQLGHWIYNKTLSTKEVGFGSFTILLRAFMNFFPDKSEHDHLNNWYFTRYQGIEYDATLHPDLPDGVPDYAVWSKIPQKMMLETEGAGRVEITERIWDQSTERTMPEKSQVTSQQYTDNGAMFTYDFIQAEGEDATAFVRIPLANEFSTDKAEQIAIGTKFEFFEFQHRTHSSQFGSPPSGDNEYFHPHYRADDLTSTQDMIFFLENAFEAMVESVKLENRR